MAKTAVSARSSGRPAATSAPNATTRISSVIGSERNSAFLKSSSKDFDSALSALASPNCSTRSCGLAFWAAAVAASGGVDAVLGLIVVARELERDERRAAVLGELTLVVRGQRGLDVADVRDRLQAGDGVVDRGGERGIADLDRAAALDEHLLVGLVGEAAVVDRAVGDLRAAVARVRVVELLGADGASDDEGGDDERKPAEDGLLAVLRTPSRGARSEIPALQGGASSGELRGRKGPIARSRLRAHPPIEAPGQRPCGYPPTGAGRPRGTARDPAV